MCVVRIGRDQLLMETMATSTMSALNSSSAPALNRTGILLLLPMKISAIGGCPLA
jgi:hypothetical protein